MLSLPENEENELPPPRNTVHRKTSAKITRLPLKDAANVSMELMPLGASTEVLAMIRDMDISEDAARWPKKISSHVERYNIDVKRENVKTNGGEVRFNENAELCIICKEGGDDRKLISCQGFMNGFTTKPRSRPKCKSVFHLDCITTYNASDYCLRYIAQPECQNEILCPLHFCDTCYFERRKQTAFCEKLIECAYCLRSFHYEKCPPIGSKDLELTMHLENNEKHTVEMIICSAHRTEMKRKEIKQSAHIKMCCECENLDRVDDLINCRNCIRSFHAHCRGAQEIDGKIVEEDLCEFCLTGECIRYDVPVIARWKDNNFYPGFTRYWSQCPMKLRKTEKYDQHGYCTIEWQGEATSTFSIVAVADCVPIFERSLKLLGKKAKTQAKLVWRDMINRSDEYLKFDPILKEVRRKIDTSRYFEKDGEKTFSVGEPEKYVCECRKDEGDHCGTTKCSNRREYYECPPDCSTEKGKCLNRGISQKEIHPNIEKRATTHKGFGVFATGPVLAGEFIAEYAGEIISKKEVDKRNNLLHYARDLEANLYMMQLAHGRAVDAARAGNVARYINHSCDPNCETVKRTVFMKERRNEVCYDNRIAVVAIRDIQAGEELSFKYQMDGWLDSQAPNCKCGTENCVGSLGKGKIVDDADTEEEDEEEMLMLEMEKQEAAAKNKRKANMQLVPAAKRTKSKNESATLRMDSIINNCIAQADPTNVEHQLLVQQILEWSKDIDGCQSLGSEYGKLIFQKTQSNKKEENNENDEEMITLENVVEIKKKEEEEAEKKEVEETVKKEVNESETKKNPPRRRSERILLSPSPSYFPTKKASTKGKSTSSTSSSEMKSNKNV